MELILDIKILIASFYEETWINMVLCDDEFKSYAYTNKGAKKFISLFTEHDIEPSNINCTKLFGRKHSIYDEPAAYGKDYMAWYYQGQLHRDNDLYAMQEYGSQFWYYMGKLHRDNDLPACVNKKYQLWYYRGKIHRDNDLPAYIDNGEKKWYLNGDLHRDNDLPAVILDNIGKMVILFSK